MNYIELIKNFWTSHNAHSFSTTEIALYFYLLEIFNICQWKNQIKRNNRRVEADLDISYNTLKNARNKLQQANLIYFKTAPKNANVSYSLSNFDEDTNRDSIEDSIEDGSKLVSPKDKLNKTINIKGKSFVVDKIYLDVMSEMLNDMMHLERLCMNNQISLEEIQNYVKRFFVKLTNEASGVRILLAEARQHFANWLRIEIDKAKRLKSITKPPLYEQSESNLHPALR